MTNYMQTIQTMRKNRPKLYNNSTRPAPLHNHTRNKRKKIKK